MVALSTWTSSTIREFSVPCTHYFTLSCHRSLNSSDA